MMETTQGIKSIEFTGRIIRADGTIEELGQMSYWHKNPLRRAANHLRQLKRKF